MVRVAAVRHDKEDGEPGLDLAGFGAVEQFAAVTIAPTSWSTRSTTSCSRSCCRRLPRSRFRFCRGRTSDCISLGLSAYFRDSVLPVLTPLAIDEARPFPLLASLSLNLALILERSEPDEPQRLAIVQVPGGLTRLVPDPGGNGQRRTSCSRI